MTLNTPIWLVAIEQTLTTTASSGLDVAAGDGLQRGDDVRGGDHRVDREVRHRGVAALAADRDLRSRRSRPSSARAAPPSCPAAGPASCAARRSRSPGSARTGLPRTITCAAAAAFLGRLEDEVGGAVEVARLGEVARRAEQHGGVAVVAAGVHAAGVRRACAEAAGLVHRQAVHVGAQADAAAAGGLSALDDADHAGLREAAMDFDAPGLRACSATRSEVRFSSKRELGVGVDVAADLGQLGVIAADVLDGAQSFTGAFTVFLVFSRGDAVDAQARVDRIVEQIDHQVDDRRKTARSGTGRRPSPARRRSSPPG